MPKQSQPYPRQPVFKATLRLLVQNYFEHDVSKNAAALAYYLLFALFPLLIFVSNLLGLLKLDVAAVTQLLQQLLPANMVGLVEAYLDHVSQTSSHYLLWFSLVFSIWFPMRATKGLMKDVRRAYHLGSPNRPLVYAVRQLIYSAVLLAALAFILTFSTSGQRLLGYLAERLPAGSALRISDFLLAVWNYFRFFLMGLLMFTALGALYALAQDSRQPLSAILPGAVAALLAWMAVSVGFSFYVENVANYSIIYGTLGAVVVLHIWLYISAIILILGAELNSAIRTARAGSPPPETP